jgi:hypothetical protein
MLQRYRPRFWLWLLAGGILHVIGAIGFRIAVKHAPVPVPVEPPSTLELTLLDEPAAPLAVRRAQRDREAPVATRAPIEQPPEPQRESSQPLARAARPSPGGKATPPAARRSVSDGVSKGRDADGPAGDAADGPAGEGEASPGAPAASSRALSLEALGVGTVNPFLRDYERVRLSAAERLSTSLRSAIANQDQRLGLGPEGPASSAVIDIVQQSATSPDGAATLRLHTDSTGSVRRTEVVAASGDTREWERIAEALVQALHGRKLRIPHGANGMSFDLKVTSREQLPSGASPGLEINVLGQTLKHGRGDRPTKLSFLQPDIRIVSTPLDDDPAGRTVDSLVVQFTIVAFSGDPTDIGAPARRVVQARLTDLKVY